MCASMKRGLKDRYKSESGKGEEIGLNEKRIESFAQTSTNRGISAGLNEKRIERIRDTGGEHPRDNASSLNEKRIERFYFPLFQVFLL